MDNRIEDLVANALDNKPGEFTKIVADILRDRISDAVEVSKQNIAMSIFNSENIEDEDEIEDVTEVLTKNTPSSEWIEDFVKSKNPKFEGKSKKERIKMALGAYYGMHKDEDRDVDNDEELQDY